MFERRFLSRKVPNFFSGSTAGTVHTIKGCTVPLLSKQVKASAVGPGPENWFFIQKENPGSL
jgi:hypothetical protein